MGWLALKGFWKDGRDDEDDGCATEEDSGCIRGGGSSEEVRGREAAEKACGCRDGGWAIAEAICLVLGYTGGILAAAAAPILFEVEA